MKDWKTYAVVVLAAWSAFLTFRNRRDVIITQSDDESVTSNGCVSLAGMMTEKYNKEYAHPCECGLVWSANFGKSYKEDSVIGFDRLNSGGSIHRAYYVTKEYDALGRLISVSSTKTNAFVRL